ncbi:unnamed protein product [Effrenium voratum]|nr:unnamed protein product [Effrenium voratum]|mmetsp:Transcript_128524/g.305037  ORF Transcript_128524/g.305037 Transcript_128524/m.305037 type:complete len:657 (-) Transcript_128524:53-2023(-)
MASKAMRVLLVLPLALARTLVEERPVTKVVKMLKDMQDTLEKEQKADEDMYDDLKCWCKENQQGKASELSGGAAKATELASLVEELNASAESLATQMATLAKEVKEATATLDQARVLHGNQVEKYNTDEKSLYKDIEAVESAATVIGGGSALLQMPENRLKDVAAALQDAVSRRSARLDNTLSIRDHERLEAFFKDPKDFVKGQSLLQSPIGGELAGMFEGMKDDFKVDLKKLQEEMAKEKLTYEELMAGKKEEIKAGEASVESKRQQRVEKRQSMMEASFEIKNIQKAMGTSQEFLAMVEEKCSTSDQEWTERQKTRQEEIESVAKAIEVMDADEAHQTFGRTYSFLQKADDRLKRASQVLAGSADRRVAALAATAEVKGMEKVLKAIAEMKTGLKKEMQDEVEQRDFCISSFNANKAKVAEMSSMKGKHSTKLAMLKTKLETTASEISETKGQMEAAQKELKKAAEDHEKELADFNTTLADQAATQKLLTKALDSLKGFYQEAPALVQATPEGFKDYKKSGGGNAAMQLMQKIILDTKAMEAETSRAKKSSQKDFGKLAEATDKDMGAFNSKLEGQQSVKANAMETMSMTKADLKGANKELADLALEEANLHESCDFVVKNFELRQSARTEELEGLQKAKSILSGGSSFLQKRF